MRFTNVILCALFCLSTAAIAAENQAAATTEAVATAQDAATSTNLDAATDAALIEAAEKLVKEGEASATAAPAAATAAPAPVTATTTATLVKESEIPLQISSQRTAGADGSSTIWRLVASLAIIALVAGITVFTGRRWSRGKNVGGNKARIEIMHQHHLGPKKSIALIRVSGEAMLVGITDHSINMIKQVTLIDDEMETALGDQFNNFLEDDFAIEDVRRAISRGPEKLHR